MAKRKKISFKTSRGFVTFLSRSGKKITFDLTEEGRRFRRIREIGYEVRELGKELQELSHRHKSDKEVEK